MAQLLSLPQKVKDYLRVNSRTQKKKLCGGIYHHFTAREPKTGGCL